MSDKEVKKRGKLMENDITETTTGQEVPARGKLAKKSFSLNDFKSKHKINDSEDLKPLSWLPLSPAFKAATGLEGIPIGELTLVRGYSDTGKSTVAYEAAVSAQQNGYLPIIIDTENALKKEHLQNMGFDFEGDYIYVDTEYLVVHYGKKYNKDFSAPSIEDIGEFINNVLDWQESGELPMDVVFCFDSIGSTDCRKTLTAKEKDKEANNMWNAGAMEQTFKSIFHHRIPSTRKVSKKYNATVVAVQKVWFDSQSGGQGTLRHKGGEAAYSFSRLIIHVGGVKARGVEKIKITKDKKEVTLGILAPITVAKNHCSNISFSGKILSTAHGLFLEEDITMYKNKHIKDFLEQMGETSTEENDVQIVKTVDNSSED